MQQERNKKQTAVILLLLLLLLIAVIIILLLLCRLCGQNEGQAENSETVSVEKLTDTIDIPGIGALHLRADSKEQLLTIQNPPQNFCLFRITLRLEDGTILWVSDEVRPGKESDPITLSVPLEKGTYPNAVLFYECFKDDRDRTKLNNAETKLTLYVE